MKKKYLFFLLLAFLLYSQLYSDLSYEVAIQGIQDAQLEDALKTSSRLLGNSERTAASLGVLKRRSEADVLNFVKVLHALAYYNGRVEYKIDQKANPILILFTIHSGPVYPLADFKIIADDEACKFPFDRIDLADLGITLKAPAHAEIIIKAEEALLNLMAEEGFPNGEIVKREVIADQNKKDITVTLKVKSGPRAYFGVTKISGNTSVREALFYKKMNWCQGQPFSVSAVQKTVEALEGSGLFTSTNVALGDPDPKTGLMPLEIQVTEAKHRSIAGGVSYTTQRGPGVMAEWDHRNIRGMGEKISIRANVWKDTQEARFSYILPDFQRSNRDLTFSAEIEHEDVKAYTETSFSLSSLFDYRINDHLRISYGGLYKWLLTERSDHNGNFHLLKSPFQLRYTTANSALDPTKGYTLNFKVVPTVQLKAPHFVYCPTTLIGTLYHPLTEDNRLVLAAKGIVGSIIGSSRYAIPPSERFYAGSENTLRGYRYLTVSPLDHKHEPIGGRSIMVLSLEGRYRATESIGVVGFYEVGNVYESPIPQFNHKQLQSVGIGVRYHTIVPIRFDLAFPLNKRKKVDNAVQAYMSIGQSF